MPRRIHATDLSALVQCDRQVYLDYNGDPNLRAQQSGYQKWLRDQGMQHETRVIGSFATEKPVYTYDNLEIGYEITLEFMREGVLHIYQGVLIDGDLIGIPDLLERVDGPSRWGDYHYRPLDIKLASTPTEGYRLQVMAYVALLEAIQGVRPQGGLLLRFPAEERSAEHIYREEPVEFADDLYAARLAQVRELAAGFEPRPFFSSTCGGCAWRDVCIPLVDAAQDASLIPGLRRDVWRALHERGIGGLADVASADAGQLLAIKGLGEKTAPAIVRKARALSMGEMILIDKPCLPPPGDDLVFDVESVPGEGLFYLMGLLVHAEGDYRYDHHLARRMQDERQMWLDLLARFERHSGAIYHYGVYECTTVKKLGERYSTQEQAGALLDRLIDLEKVAKDCAVLPLRSTSLKAVAPWLGFAWSGAIQGGEDSMLEYLAWLDDGDQAHLDRILHYNEEDCRATLAVLEWLRGLGD